MGAILRHTAGAITFVLGVLLMLPSLWQLLVVTSEWFLTSMPYLPSIAGERIASPDLSDADREGLQALAPWTGFGGFMVHIALTLLVAAVLIASGMPEGA